MKKFLCTFLGLISLVLGIIGMFVPLLPTTPFLLLTASLFAMGSPRLNRWLLAHPFLGNYIRRFRENRAIPLHSKIISLTLMWASMLYCVLFVVPLLWLKLLLLAIAVGITVHILSYKTM